MLCSLLEGICEGLLYYLRVELVHLFPVKYVSHYPRSRERDNVLWYHRSGTNLPSKKASRMINVAPSSYKYGLLGPLTKFTTLSTPTSRELT